MDFKTPASSGRVPVLSGLINVHKPSGITSRDAVNHIQRLVRPSKAGHAGTLDPLASGVLMIALGNATRLIEFVQQMPKRYRATFLLGRSSTTEDVEGEITELATPPVPTREALETGAKALTGPILQRPPAYSAIKVGGRRSYNLARKGNAPVHAPRPVAIYEFTITGYAYPEFSAEIECSSGAYIRSLGRDLAEALGTAAVMSSLVRTAIGEFHVAEACELRELTAETIAASVLPLERAVALLPRVDLTEEETRTVRFGRPIQRSLSDHQPFVAAFDAFGRLAAILAPREAGWLAPERVMAV